jgi:hypothetical protein
MAMRDEAHDDVQPSTTPPGSLDESGGLDLDFDPGTTDLGFDVYREAGLDEEILPLDDESTMEGGLEPGNTDLGPDVYRPASQG